MVNGFLDTNIFLRHLLNDIPDQTAKATTILQRIENGELTVRTSDAVVFETIFTLQRSYKKPRVEIAAGLLPLLDLPGIILPGKRHFQKVFGLYTTTPIGFIDCYHIVLLDRLGLTDIFSFDTDFDGLPDLHRREA